jgi:hypothetical protein
MEKQALETNVIKPKCSFYFGTSEYRLISSEDEKNLDSKIDIISTFMANNNGFGQSEETKDDLYARSKELWRQYAAALRDTKYTFWMNRKQFQFITDLILRKLEYDVNTVFFAIELRNMLGSWKKESTNKDDESFKEYTADATEITYLYHLIAKYKIKGLTDEAFLFADVLRKIGDISKIINYYDTAAKNLSKEIQEWVASFEPEEKKPENEIESTEPAL